MAYEAIIQGKKVSVEDWDDDHHLRLSDGARFELDVLPGQAVDAAGLRSLTLREATKLTFTGGGWLLNDSPLVERWKEQCDSKRTEASDTELFTLWTLEQVLKGKAGRDLQARYANAGKRMESICFGEGERTKRRAFDVAVNFSKN